MTLQSGVQPPARPQRPPSGLELKIPPPIVAALIALAMWFFAGVTPAVPAPVEARIGVAALIALLGAAFDAAALLRFFRADTTINPLRPGKSSALVTSGVYRLSRNPMYAGLLLFLVAWAAYLASPLAFAGPMAFVAFINRFQILPEERILSAMFSAEYDDYKSRVRRWL